MGWGVLYLPYRTTVKELTCSFLVSSESLNMFNPSVLATLCMSRIEFTFAAMGCLPPRNDSLRYADLT